MVTLKALGVRLRKAPPTGALHPLEEALVLVGITTPTYYRWLKVGKVEDSRVRGPGGKVYLPATAIARLREVAARVEYRAE